MKNVFVFTCCKGDISVNPEACQSIANVVQALDYVLEHKPWNNLKELIFYFSITNIVWYRR